MHGKPFSSQLMLFTPKHADRLHSCVIELHCKSGVRALCHARPRALAGDLVLDLSLRGTQLRSRSPKLSFTAYALLLYDSKE